VVELY